MEPSGQWESSLYAARSALQSNVNRKRLMDIWRA
jgi:hypothetical protein